MNRPICVIGNVNIDVVLGPLSAWPEPGTETFVPKGDFRIGGSAGNTALALRFARSDYPSGDAISFGLISAVGTDAFADLILPAFSGPLDRIGRMPGQTGMSVGVLFPGAERSFLSFNGHLDRLDYAMLADALQDWPLQGALALVSGAFAMPALLCDQDRLIERLRHAGAEVALDPGWPGEGWTSPSRSRVSGWAQHCDHLLLNDKEACGLTGCDDLDEAVAVLAGLGGPETAIVIKCGARGARMRKGAVDHRCSAERIDALDTVGAGDAFNAGYLAAHAAGEPPLQALAAGVQLATRVVARFPRSGI